ncbi:unnamed protein product [Amoebophrya sp. A120]|nr:unnamed protein product [Amoebophrya sp. A120]|eukprot:GSA120T00025817001.1
MRYHALFDEIFQRKNSYFSCGNCTTGSATSSTSPPLHHHPLHHHGTKLIRTNFDVLSEDQEHARQLKVGTSSLYAQLQKIESLTKELLTSGLSNQKKKSRGFGRIARSNGRKLGKEVHNLQDMLKETKAELETAEEKARAFSMHLKEQIKAEEDGTGSKLPQAVYDTGSSAWKLLVEGKQDLRKLLDEGIPNLERRVALITVK